MKSLFVALAICLGVLFGFALKTYTLLVVTLVAVVIFVLSLEQAKFKHGRKHFLLFLFVLMMWITHYIHVLKV